MKVSFGIGGSQFAGIEGDMKVEGVGAISFHLYITRTVPKSLHRIGELKGQFRLVFSHEDIDLYGDVDKLFQIIRLEIFKVDKNVVARQSEVPQHFGFRRTCA